MANAAAKRLAAQNEQSIKRLNMGMAIVNLNWLLLRYLLNRPSFPFSQITLYVLTLVPEVLIYRWLVRSGTPQRDSSGLLITPGEDLGQAGLVEYAWDILYVTWACVLGSAVLGGWVWWFYLAIPGFALYKGGSLLLPLLRSSLPSLSALAGPGTAGPGAGAGAGGAAGAGGMEGLEGGAAESKRQQKLRKRMERGDPRVRQVERKRAA